LEKPGKTKKKTRGPRSVERDIRKTVRAGFEFISAQERRARDTKQSTKKVVYEGGIVSGGSIRPKQVGKLFGGNGLTGVKRS